MLEKQWMTPFFKRMWSPSWWLEPLADLQKRDQDRGQGDHQFRLSTHALRRCLTQKDMVRRVRKQEMTTLHQINHLIYLQKLHELDSKKNWPSYLIAHVQRMQNLLHDLLNIDNFMEFHNLLKYLNLLENLDQLQYLHKLKYLQKFLPMDLLIEMKVDEMPFQLNAQVQASTPIAEVTQTLAVRCRG